MKNQKLRSYLVINMPLKLLLFLIENKILHQFITYVLRDQKGIRTAHEIIKFISKQENRIFCCLFEWTYTDEGFNFWIEIDTKWRKYLLK